ncbi:MAG: PAS domain S-box-containing protein, partial [Limisphaerales bacterium]
MNLSLKKENCPHGLRLSALTALLAVGVHFTCQAQLAVSSAGGAIEDMPRIRALAQRAPETHAPVQITGIAQLEMPDGGIVFVHDGDQGLLVDLGAVTGAEFLGKKVLVKGVVDGSRGAHVRSLDIKPLTPSLPAPPAAELTPVELLEENQAYRWRETVGLVRSATKTQFGWRFELNEAGRTYPVATVRRGRAVTAYTVNAVVRFRGVTLPMKTIAGESDELVLWVDDWSRIDIERAPPQLPFRKPIRPIAGIVSAAPDELESHRVRVRARVEAVEGAKSLVLADASGSLLAGLAMPVRVRAGDFVDALGFMESVEQRGVTLEHATLRLLSPPPGGNAGSVGRGLSSMAWDALVPTIERMETIVGLSSDEAKKQHPVRVTGVATLVQTNRGVVYFQNETAALRASGSADASRVTPGDRVEVSGYTSADGFGSSIVAAGIRVLENEGRIRPPKVTTTSLLAGLHENELIHIEAVVRSIDRGGDRLLMKLSHSARIFHAQFDAETALPDRLVGARVGLTGVARVVVNPDNQAIGARILAGRAEDLAIVDPISQAPFNKPAMMIAELGGFREGASVTRRNRVVGTVTLKWPDRIYLRDDTGQIEVRMANTGSLSVGDDVNVLGFLDLDGNRTLLVDAEAALIASGRDLIPTETDAGALYRDGDSGNSLVAVSGRLLGKNFVGRRASLLLGGGSASFRGVLPASEAEALAGLREGSVVRVEGVSAFRGDKDSGEESLEILMSSAADVTVLRAAPRFSSGTLLAAIGALVAVILAALGWVAFLRQRVKHTESRFAKAFEASPLPVAIGTRKEQRILDVNDAFLTQFGYLRDEVAGRTIEELGLCPDSEFAAQFQSDLRQRSAVRGLQSQLRSKTGEVREMLVSAEPIQIEGEACLLFIFQDISERLELMNQLRESQKMEAVGRLAAGIAHDFNNLLTIICGNNELLENSIGLNAENAEYHGAVTTAANRAADLTRQLLAFSSKQVMHRAAVNLDDLIRASTRMMHRTLGEDIDIVESLGARGVLVDSDQGMLSQVVLNLAVNARDAMPRGGKLSVATKVVELRPDNLPEHPDARDGEFVRVTISDTGSGMDSETLSHIFEPFYTTKETGKGTGLGLSTVFGIVKQHQGWISVASRVGEGSQFEIFLPLAGRA